MADGTGGRTPYATACLIFGLADDPSYATYVRGKLRMAGVTLDDPLAEYLDAAYAAVCDAPHELLEKLQASITLKSAQLRPDRATWGLLPEHVALSQKITGQPGKAVGREESRVQRGGFGPAAAVP